MKINLYSSEFWKMEKFLLFSVIILILLGTIAVDSASMLPYLRFRGGGFRFFFKHLLSIFAGLFLATSVLLTRKKFYRENSFVVSLSILTFILLSLVFFFPARNNVHRWVNFLSISFQPSELAKLTLILGLSLILGRAGTTKKEENEAIIYSLAITILIAAETDFGTALFIALISGIIFYISGMRLKKILGISLIFAAGILITALLPQASYLRNRFFSFMKDPRAIYQRKQALIALGSGGITGRSPGESLQKFLYLPEAHSDFIFSILGEEMGLIATLTVLLGFLAIAYSGFKIARRARDSKSKLIAYGISSALSIQALMNISINIGIFLSKGIPLPFISFGGSSMVISILMASILMHIWIRRRDET